VQNFAFYAAAQMKITPVLKGLMMQPAPVVRAWIRALQAGRISVVPGWANKALVILTRATPLWLHQAFLSRAMNGWATTPDRVPSHRDPDVEPMLVTNDAATTETTPAATPEATLARWQAEEAAVRAEGRLIHDGGRVATAEGRIFGPDGKLYAHSNTTCLVFDRAVNPAG
jgi:hypothetical protein